jgi:hypothetical protein
MTTTALLDHLIDYAGTFPPAALPLEEAVAEYRRLQTLGAQWVVGPLLVRSVDVPATAELLKPHAVVDLAVAFVSGSLAQDLDLVGRRPPGVRLVQMEMAVPVDVAVLKAHRSWTGDVALYCELAGPEPLADQLGAIPPLAAALAGVVDVRVKIRTGGPTVGAVPSSDRLAEFLVACHRGGLSYKATAGLHHPYRHFDEATGGDQHGFVNVLAASALATAGLAPDALLDVLEARSPADLSAAWARSGGTATPDRTRRFFRSFGSCSAAEPIEHLEHLGVLDPSGRVTVPDLW